MARIIDPTIGSPIRGVPRNSIQLYDHGPKYLIQPSDHGPPCRAHNRESRIDSSLVLEDELYAVGDGGVVVFDPIGSPSQWRYGTTELDLGFRVRGTVLDGVLYCYFFLGRIWWYYGKENRWKESMELEKKLSLAAVGGRLFAVWKKKIEGKPEAEIICSGLEVCKRSCGELRGFAVWSDVIVSVPITSSILGCFAVGL
eukprot:TRINITY_DN1213_c0_g1_i1.p1 TRINITY_DN1213_c0_g1~~TRINITY_DN1213_c0_g1_i1.p1  ORF type:complete len:199 (+),score=15.02 TRINITY_DN1213_c0_g1_i1:174-770(+)